MHLRHFFDPILILSEQLYLFDCGLRSVNCRGSITDLYLLKKLTIFLNDTYTDTMPIKAIILDVDGTLADTEDAHRIAFNKAFAENHLSWNWDVALSSS
jgi:hypothetical protein